MYKASLLNLRVSPRKANQVVSMVRGMPVFQAMRSLDFCSKRIAKDISKLIRSAMSNAENNFNADIDNLKVAEIWVGRATPMRRLRWRAKGRGDMIERPFSNVYVTLEERKA
ncbi:MAG: 50S ribosomal protein L22 [Alphaproteobacteria bacterium]|nr:MAG: 50S ribosomal protein L22 [Alphaproteobacteria bacterium]